MAKRIIENDEYDFTLGRTTKIIVALACQALSWLDWGLFSTPATLEFCRRFSDNIMILNFYPGEYMGYIAGLMFSFGEQLFTYLWLWKRNNIYWVVIGLCMLVSIAATTGFTNIGHQEANIKYDSIQNAEMIVNNTREAIDQEKRNFDAYERQEKRFESKGERVPWYVNHHRRKSQERLDSLYACLNLQTKNVTQIKQQTGAIVTIDPLKSKHKIFNFSNFLAVFLECMIVILLIVGVGVWRKIDSPLSDSDRTKSDSDSDSELAKLSDVGQLMLGLKNGVRPIILSSPSDSRPIGFGRSDSDQSDSERIIKSDNKILRVNTVEAICIIYDYFVDNNLSWTKTGIADMVGCDEKWVRRILKRERGV